MTAPDVVLIEAAQCDAASVGAIRVRWAHAKVVAYAVSEDGDEAIGCAEAGASGYVTREATVQELVDTVRRVAAGEFPCTPRVAALMAHRLSALAGAHAGEPPPQVLTQREQEVARLIDAGQSNKEIARHLGIELSTVKHHVHQILHKTQARRRYQATARLRASEAGLAVTPPWRGSRS